jgi:hypothetical protein
LSHMVRHMPNARAELINRSLVFVRSIWNGATGTCEMPTARVTQTFV